MAASDYVTEVLSDSPIAFWDFQDASGYPVDSSGNGLDMTTTTGTISYQELGPLGEDYSIRIAAGRISRAKVTSAVNDFSMEWWIQLINPSFDGGLIGTATTGGANGWSVITAVTPYVQAVCQGVALMNTSTALLPNPVSTGNVLLPMLGVGAGKPTVGGWTHLVVTRDSGTWKYYFNGSVETSNAGTTAPTAPGGSAVSFVGDEYLAEARFAYPAIYETALSSTQVSDHYNAAFA